MSEKIEPALTVSEWESGYFGQDIDIAPARVGVWLQNRLHVDVRATPLDNPGDFAALIALANAALPDGDPRKIDGSTITDLRLAAVALEVDAEAFQVDNRRFVSDLRRIADALSSYLPPESLR